MHEARSCKPAEVFRREHFAVAPVVLPADDRCIDFAAVESVQQVTRLSSRTSIVSAGSCAFGRASSVGTSEPATWVARHAVTASGVSQSSVNERIRAPEETLESVFLSRGLVESGPAARGYDADSIHRSGRSVGIDAPDAQPVDAQRSRWAAIWKRPRFNSNGT